MKKKKQLKNMDIDEVSLVDRPANKRKFLLIKREDGEVTELTIKTDGTFDGTTLSVNGEEADDLKAFWFSLWPPDDFDQGMMMGSYTVSETDGAEFDQETTFNLKKGMNTMKQITLGALLKSLNVDAASLSEERTAEVESLLKFVNMMPPEDAASALNIIKASLVKEETPAEGEPPAADETAEEMDPEKVVEIKSAMTQLNEMLPEGERSVLKTAEPDKMDVILAAIAGINKTEDQKPADKDAAPDSAADILKRLVKVEKTTGVTDDEDEEAEETPTPMELYTKLTKEDKLAKFGTLYGKTQANMGFDLKEYLEGQ